MADPTARTLRLLSLLQTHRFWPGSELSERLGVSARTLRRDIDRLRELGYAIDASPGVAGGYQLATGSELPPLVLDDDEAVAIAVGLRAAAGAAIEGIEDTAVRALAKLEQVLPTRLRRRVAAVHGTTAVLRWSAPRELVDGEALATLATACRDREEVRFDYERADGERTSRLVRPHQLVSVGRRWYLVAWDVRRDDWRTFRLDRLAGARLAGVRFAERALPDGLDATAFVARSLRQAPTPHRAVVRVAAPAEQVEQLAGWLGGDLEAAGEGTCRVALRSESREWLVSMVAALAARHDVTLEGDDAELAALVAATGRRLAAAPPGDGGLNDLRSAAEPA